MASTTHETYTHTAPPLPSDRSTGLVFAGASAVIAWLARHSPFLWPALGACASFLAVALVKPDLLRPLNIAWMRLAHLMNRVMSPVIMGVLFLVTIVPFGLAMQLVRDPLRRRRTKDLDSYWLPVTADGAKQPRDMRNQF